jgi:hypothetical protein
MVPSGCKPAVAGYRSSLASCIHGWALQQRALPESPLGRAIGYLGAIWQGLLVFLREPEVDIDNNDVERALRGIVTLVSLCSAFLSTWNHESAIISRIATRASRTLATAA